MKPAFVVDIVTPKRILLNGLWFGPRKPKRAIIFVHGLGGSVFSMRRVIDALADQKTAVLAFNNRGFGDINTVKRKTSGKSKYVMAGAGHEIFTDSVDDLQGAINFARREGVREIYLAGHSTGCQKAILWASRIGRGVRGIILLAPVSDWAAEVKLQGKKKVAATAAVARVLVRSGRKHELLPKGKVVARHAAFDAQRILSLYTPESLEEIFPYAQPKKIPRALQSVRVPILVLWAGKDEYAESPRAITEWFEKSIKAPHRVVVVPKVGHGFKGGEREVQKAVNSFIMSS